MGEMKVEMIAGTPMEAAYLAKSPHPDLEHLQVLLDKLGGYDRGANGWSDDDIRGIAAPTLITVGDNDAVKLEHAVKFAQLRGSDVNGDFVGVPASQLAVFPGTTHFFGMARTNLVTRRRRHVPRRADAVGAAKRSSAPSGCACRRPGTACRGSGRRG